MYGYINASQDAIYCIWTQNITHRSILLRNGPANLEIFKEMLYEFFDEMF